MTKKIRIALAESNELFRKSLVALLQTRPEFEIVGEALNGKELIDLLKQKTVDIALLNVDMPVMSGRETLNLVQMRFPEVKVITLNNQVSHHLTTDFMTLGARCYLTVDCGVETLFEAIIAVDVEGYYFDSSISKAMLGALIKDKTGNTALTKIVFNARETEILKALCEGKTNKEIASSLYLSTSTIDFYKAKIYEKVNCNNVTGLLRFALKNGIVALE